MISRACTVPEFVHKREIDLTPTEYKILLFLADHVGLVLTRKQIYEAVWNEAFFDGFGKTVNNHIQRMKQKIAEKTDAEIIIAIFGAGYKLLK